MTCIYREGEGERERFGNGNGEVWLLMRKERSGAIIASRGTGWNFLFRMRSGPSDLM